MGDFAAYVVKIDPRAALGRIVERVAQSIEAAEFDTQTRRQMTRCWNRVAAHQCPRTGPARRRPLLLRSGRSPTLRMRCLNFVVALNFTHCSQPVFNEEARGLNFSGYKALGQAATPKRCCSASTIAHGCYHMWKTGAGRALPLEVKPLEA